MPDSHTAAGLTDPTTFPSPSPSPSPSESPSPSITEPAQSRRSSQLVAPLTKDDTRSGRFPIRTSRDRRNSRAQQSKRMSVSPTPLVPSTHTIEESNHNLSTTGASPSPAIYTNPISTELRRSRSSTSSLLLSGSSKPIFGEEKQPTQPQVIPTPSFTYNSSTLPRTRRGNTLSESTSAASAPSGATLLNPNKPSPSQRASSPGGKLRGIFRSKKSNSSLKSANSNPESAEDPASEAVEPVSVPEPPSNPYISSDPNHRREVPTQTQANSTSAVTPPKTPPESDEPPAPRIVNTPPTPTNPQFSANSTPSKALFSSSPSNPDASQNENSPPITPLARASTTNVFQGTHRRLRSGSAGPSKLSSITLPPLSPTPEAASLLDGTVDSNYPQAGSLPSRPATSANATTGFFSSMISAAQSAATSIGTTLTNTSINVTKGQKPSSASNPATNSAVDSTVSVEQPTLDSRETTTTNMEPKEPAVKTLGAGDLSLSQLGLADPQSKAIPSPGLRHSATDTVFEANRVRSESSPSDAARPADSSLDDTNRTGADYLAGDASPNHSIYGDGNTNSGLQRNPSIRSTLERHRKRGGSAATGGTIGAAIAAVNQSSVPLHTNINASVPKLTGFAIASKKRNKDFHMLFKSVPDDDYLIEDYSCALQREILCQGRLYVSEGHLCFSSNILGWVTTLVIGFDEIVAVEKRNTALIFKNGLMISTLQNKHIFASFTSRDATYDLIINIWKLGHPSLNISADKTEKAMDDGAMPLTLDDGSSGSEGDSDDEDDVYDEDDDDTEAIADPAATSNVAFPEIDTEKTASRKISAAGGPSLSASDSAPALPGGSQDFPGPATHPPTDCGDTTVHYDRVVGDDIVPAPLGKVFDMLFGQTSVTFIQKFITEGQKCFDYVSEDKKGLSLENKSRSCSYIKPLAGSIGPKQTKCLLTETIDGLDFNKAVNITASTQTPDVPSGNLFVVKTHYCLSWAENNQTRIQVNCTVEWSGKSWIKGPIEKGANDGQLQYCNDLFAAIRAALPSRPRAGTGNGATTRSKKKSRKGAATESSPAAKVVIPPPQVANWGVFEPIRPVLEPLTDILKPLLTGNIMYGLLVGLLVAAWFGFGSQSSANSAVPHNGGNPMHMGFHTYPDRIAAYEEMWRREESQLWEWLEERVHLGRITGDHVAFESGSPGRRRKPIDPRTLEERLREEKMDEAEIQEAISVTQRKLDILKEVMEKKKMASSKEQSAKDSSAGVGTNGL